MTNPDLDTWRAAALLIKQHGEDAQLVALKRQAEMAMSDDFEGVEVWRRIRRAIMDLQAPPVGRAH